MSAASARLVPSSIDLPRLHERDGASLRDFALVGRPIPRPEEIRAATFLVEGHPLEGLLRREGIFSRSDIEAIRGDSRLSLSFAPLDSGAIAASSNPATTYAQHCWTRDAMVSAFALYRGGRQEEAKRVVHMMAEFYGSEWQRARFVSYLFSSDPVGDFERGKNLPMVRAPISTEGKLVDQITASDGRIVSRAEDWGHKQLDAIGAWLWTTFRMANRGGIDPVEISNGISGKVNGHEKLESFFVVAVRFLHRIQCWKQSDLGPWEEGLGAQRASSLGSIKAALCEMHRYFERAGWDVLPIAKVEGRDSVAEFQREFLELSGHVSRVIDQRIPNDPAQHAVETTTESAAQIDVALAHLLFPVDADLTHTQERTILRSVYSLMGEVGFIRYLKDAYVGMDHIHGDDLHLKSDTRHPNYRPAEWCTIDPLLAGYYFRRYLRSGGDDRDALDYGTAHLRRALAQITARPDGYTLKRCGTEVAIPSGASPEAYFWDSRAGKWRANLNTPLHWSASLLSIALTRAEEASELALRRA